jgi:hypothetical protein
VLNESLEGIAEFLDTHVFLRMIFAADLPFSKVSVSRICRPVVSTILCWYGKTGWKEIPLSGVAMPHR